jgi:6-pyruvoyltetrahydropterin/6-carboxytetrahydropterin synthase
MSITKRFTFSASHRLFNRAMSEDDNRALFGQCNRSHGHNFILEITVEGPVDKKTGMVINFHDLKYIVNTNVVEYFDHKDFERDIPEFADKVQTVEALAQIAWDRLADKFPFGPRLVKIKISETSDNWVEMGEGGNP